ncbi:MAG: cobalamin 5'-phosphate synthase [Desulfuromonadales bacterium C00003093]|nr:MAG: cobalamin 5'-phosphate synthase [Desulfuromonadales bacterium C00003093]
MKGLRGAIGFLTVLPVARSLPWQGSAMLPWFPVVGLMLGCLWIGFDIIMAMVFPCAIRAFLDVLFLIFLTGGLHLDGLADSADGLLSHRDKKKSLEIMKDSRIGTWGVLALMTVLGLKTLALCEIVQKWGPALPLIMIPAYGRTAMLLGICFLPYGRGDDGIAYELFQKGIRPEWIPGMVLTGLATLLLSRPDALVINVTFGLSVFVILAWYRLQTGCITGDMLGALGEITETFLLVALAA